MRAHESPQANWCKFVSMSSGRKGLLENIDESTIVWHVLACIPQHS